MAPPRGGGCSSGATSPADRSELLFPGAPTLRRAPWMAS